MWEGISLNTAQSIHQLFLLSLSLFVSLYPSSTPQNQPLSEQRHQEADTRISTKHMQTRWQIHHEGLTIKTSPFDFTLKGSVGEEEFIKNDFGNMHHLNAISTEMRPLRQTTSFSPAVKLLFKGNRIYKRNGGKWRVDRGPHLFCPCVQIYPALGHSTDVWKWYKIRQMLKLIPCYKWFCAALFVVFRPSVFPLQSVVSCVSWTDLIAFMDQVWREKKWSWSKWNTCLWTLGHVCILWLHCIQINYLHEPEQHWSSSLQRFTCVQTEAHLSCITVMSNFMFFHCAVLFQGVTASHTPGSCRGDSSGQCATNICKSTLMTLHCVDLSVRCLDWFGIQDNSINNLMKVKCRIYKRLTVVTALAVFFEILGKK